MRESLADRTAGQLLAFIADRHLRDGDRLPPEHELTAALSVSRTVLREAVAGLRAQGRLTSRRGSGVFVATPKLGIRLAPDDTGSIPDLLRTMELRAAVEIEAAGLAARRRNAAQLDAIRTAFAATLRRGRETAPADFAFHRAIADATGNDRFGWFLDELGPALIPRGRLRASSVTQDYYALLEAEHRAILTAIETGDVSLAHDAMRQHLGGSTQRYTELAAIKEPNR